MATDAGEDCSGVSQEVLGRLCERFPGVQPDRVAQALRACGGHAGQAAAKLRELTSGGVRQADPEDAEHVRTLLSSPAILGQVCSEHFRMFDANGDHALEWNEILDLTNSLHENFGLPLPREGGLRSFFETADTNSDGKLTEEEFFSFFHSYMRYAFLGPSPKQQRKPKEAGAGAPHSTLSRNSSAGALSKPCTPEGGASRPGSKRGGQKFARFWDVVEQSKHGEQEWRESTQRLQERFPSIRQDYIEKVFRDAGGHAGEAATVLRSMSRCQSVC